MRRAGRGPERSDRWKRAAALPRLDGPTERPSIRTVTSPIASDSISIRFQHLHALDGVAATTERYLARRPRDFLQRPLVIAGPAFLAGYALVSIVRSIS